ncbi:MAG TPA: ABC transporter ATP-binding protein [Kiritimatiellia bacterium]|nr:ABC transporter ATP-binding protein [Kiritimatiellia bacterium]HMO97663.1 ABC transporter ATP-binding protein [Kiritimatiellia bacterium]HMP95524.1 ABC transporter ATP-binding protein [Kiritimatiellia bacterium]
MNHHGDDLLRADRLVLRYPGMQAPALNQVSVGISSGVTLGIVGESGSGKSSLARCLLGLESPAEGCVYFRGRPLSDMTGPERRVFRGKVQMVFQDPFNSLNPRMTVGETLGEVLRVHGLAASRREAEAGGRELLDRVGLAAGVAGRYPHEVSGGQRQRVGIARALALKPDIMIADEPVSALDVSVQAHILNLLKDLVEATGVTLVLIAHDLAVVRYVCRRVAVMCRGEIVEEGEGGSVIDTPRHPYTRDLLAAVPEIDII